MQVFTFFCIEPDGSVPRFDITACVDDEAARARAADLIGVHRCGVVEVWRGARCEFEVRRAA